jgi:hypothetical protein
MDDCAMTTMNYSRRRDLVLRISPVSDALEDPELESRTRLHDKNCLFFKVFGRVH